MAEPASPATPVPDLDAMQWIGDPHADDTVARILHGCNDFDAKVARIKAVNDVIKEWTDNSATANWTPTPAQVEFGVGIPLKDYVAVATLPPAASEKAAQTRCGETLFMDHGVLSVTLLFCSSLPECYVVPDLAAVLHATGQLELRADHRIRATGAMVFPVMMEGGMTSPGGTGIAQVLKVRLIHAMVRHLILRGSPSEVAEGFRTGPQKGRPVEALGTAAKTDSMYDALHKRGWNLETYGVPNNQEELAYTLLTFSYVVLRGMRKLGLPFTEQEEKGYLETWNMAGHYLGIHPGLMAHTMEEAESLFAKMQARGRADRAARPEAIDPRPLLGQALMDAMNTVIPPGWLRWFPVLLTRYLIGRTSSSDLGLTGRVPLAARVLFITVMVLIRGIDWVVRLAFPTFSISRFITRIIGYPLMCRLLMDMTRELAVPDKLKPQITQLLASWGTDRQAPAWINKLEDRFTTQGEWQRLSPAPKAS